MWNSKGNFMEKVNLYCDESCHLEHDCEKIMVIGGIKCLKARRKYIRRELEEIKKRQGISKYAEIKWNKVSKCNLNYFKEIIDFFFQCDDLSFRAVVVDKTELRHEEFNQTHDEFYYKMYYYCLAGLIDTKRENYIYLDKKDTKGTRRIQKLQFCLSQKTHDFDNSSIKRIQCANSMDLPVLQITDLLIGAIGYWNREIENRSEAKIELVNYIIQKSGYSLKQSTLVSENKFNLFFMDLNRRRY